MSIYSVSQRNLSQQVFTHFYFPQHSSESEAKVYVHSTLFYSIISKLADIIRHYRAYQHKIYA